MLQILFLIKDMKTEIVTCKKGRACTYCSSMIGKGEKLLESTDWVAGGKFPIKKNICFKCLESNLQVILYLENCLKDLKQLEQRSKNI